MKNKKTIIIVVIVVVFAALGYFVYRGYKKSQADKALTTTTKK